MKLGFATLVVAALATLAAATASATTTVAVSMTLAEPLIAGWPGPEPCPDIGRDVNCGSGEVTPFGHALEIVSIGACGESCAIRRIDLPQGSFVMFELLSDISCPGACVTEWPHGAPFYGNLTGTIVAGTGVFEGARGTLTGTLRAAAFHAQIKLAGAITLAS